MAIRKRATSVLNATIQLLIFLILALPARANPDAAALDLKSCVNAQIAQSSNPEDLTAEALLQACANELRILLDQVPANFRNEVLHKVLHQTEAQLNDME